MHLQIRDIEFKYKNSKDLVLNKVSFDMKEGELLAIVGESGSGKSTILRLLAGLETPLSGEIAVGGRVFWDKKTNLMPEERGLGMVFQDYALFPHMTVEKNIMFGLKKMSLFNKKTRVEEMLTLVDLKGLGKRYPHELSGGQQQRVALARALAPQPKLLLMDEPFSNLDANLHDKIRNELEGIIRKAGITTIFVTHNKRDALESADQVIVMEKGQIIEHGVPVDVFSEKVDIVKESVS